MMMRKKWAVIAICLGMIAVITSCKDNLIGRNIMPPGDNINGTFTDTLTLSAKTILEQPLKTSLATQFVVGSVNDAVFGKSFAGLYSQFSLPANNINLGDADTLTLDSMVVSLAYNSFYGDEAKPMSVKVFQLDNDMANTVTYYTNQVFSVFPVSVGERNSFIPDPRSKQYIDGDTLAPQMRIRLSDRVGRWFLDQSGQAALASNTNFLTVFKGLYIAPDTANGYGNGFAYLDMTSTASRLNLYYHTPHTANKKYYFPIASDAAITNYYQHGYTGTPVGDSLTNQHLYATVCYASSLSGVKTNIMIPHLKNLGRVLINKAELEVTQLLDASQHSSPDDTLFPKPYAIIVARADSAGKNLITPDQLFSTLSYGGNAKTEVLTTGQTVIRYRISLAEEVQKMLDDATEVYGLNLIIYQSGETADRLIFGGTGRNDDMKLRLNVIYTKIQ